MALKRYASDCGPIPIESHFEPHFLNKNGNGLKNALKPNCKIITYSLRLKNIFPIFPLFYISDIRACAIFVLIICTCLYLMCSKVGIVGFCQETTSFWQTENLKGVVDSHGAVCDGAKSGNCLSCAPTGLSATINRVSNRFYRLDYLNAANWLWARYTLGDTFPFSMRMKRAQLNHLWLGSFASVTIVGVTHIFFHKVSDLFLSIVNY